MPRCPTSMSNGSFAQLDILAQGPLGSWVSYLEVSSFLLCYLPGSQTHKQIARSQGVFSENMRNSLIMHGLSWNKHYL